MKANTCHHTPYLKRALLSAVATLLLSGCASPTLQPDETETFTTRILDNDTKLFTYQLDTPSRRPIQPKLVFDANEPTDLNNPQPMQPYDAEAEKAGIEQRVLTLVNKKIDVTGYCREGYVVASKKIGFTRSVVSGECREAATSEDRERFSSEDLR